MKYLPLLCLLLAQPVFAVTVDLDPVMPNPLLYVRWDNGKTNCILFPTGTGVRFDTPSFSAGETLQKYIERSWKYQPFSKALKARCEVMAVKYKEIWAVAPLTRKGKAYDRPVYAPEGFPARRLKIGVAKSSTPCGAFVAAYSARIKALTWRRVAINGVTGVTVCRK